MEGTSENGLKSLLVKNEMVVAVLVALLVGLGVYLGLFKKEAEPEKLLSAVSCPNTTCTNHYKKVYISPTQYYCKAC